MQEPIWGLSLSPPAGSVEDPANFLLRRFANMFSTKCFVALDSVLKAQCQIAAKTLV